MRNPASTFDFGGGAKIKIYGKKEVKMGQRVPKMCVKDTN